ncbi:MAG: hypothetical protein U1E13_09105 [Methylophilaceae bacterium]|nr:hypothetical protein [Methylophilaceae bacterium]
MPYVLKDNDGNIKAVSLSDAVPLGSDWHSVDIAEYLHCLESAMAKVEPFRESDIRLARVLEDLINVLINRDVIRFTDLPEAARRRLLERQALRSKTSLSNILDDSGELSI